MRVLKIVIIFFILMTFISCSKGSKEEHDTLNSLSGCTPDTYDFTPLTFLDGLLTIQIPGDFETMSQERIKIKYPNAQRPTIVLTNDDGSVNVAINHTNNNVLPEQIADVHRSMEKMFNNMYPSAQWNESEILSTGKRKYFVLDLVTPAADTEVRNIMVGTSLNGRMLLVTFNTTVEFEDEWADKGRCIMSSIEINV